MAKTAPEISLSFIRIDRDHPAPLYQQLYTQIRDGILSGMLRPLERMPSSRLFAAAFDISRNTVTAAFDQLILEGYLEGAIGSGTYVSNNIGRKSQLAPQMPKAQSTRNNDQHGYPTRSRLPDGQIAQSIKPDAPVPFQFSLTAVAQFPFPIWASIASSIYKNISALNLGYGDAQGHYPLRKAIAAYLRLNRSIDCAPEQVVIVNGSRQAVHLFCKVWLSAGDTCWVEDPGYPGVRSAINSAGASVCPVPVSNKGLDLDHAMEVYPEARAAFITPSHQFPLGGTMPLPERLRLIAWAGEKNRWIIEDDYDSEFRYKGRPIPALMGLDTHQRVIYIGTFSKILFPALRIGYMVMPDADAAQLMTLAKGQIDRQNPVIDQAILTRFITDGHLSRHLRKMRSLYKHSLDFLTQLIQTQLSPWMEAGPAEAGMHLVVWLKHGLNAAEVATRMDQAGYFVETVDHFSQQYPHPTGLILGYTGLREEQLTAGTKQLQAILMAMHPL